MEKGKFGIRLGVYGVLAFFMVLFGNYITLLLLAAFVLAVEKNEWATRQVLQAIILYSLPYIVSMVFTVLGLIDWLNWASFVRESSFFSGSLVFWNRFQTIVKYAANVCVYVFSILSILKNVKGQDAAVPFASKFADWAYGVMIPKAAPAPVAPMQPMQQAPVQPVAPVQPAPMQQAPVQPMAPVQPAAPMAGVCVNCGTPLNGAAFCTKCGTPAAK